MQLLQMPRLKLSEVFLRVLGVSLQILLLSSLSSDINSIIFVVINKYEKLTVYLCITFISRPEYVAEHITDMRL